MVVEDISGQLFGFCESPGGWLSGYEGVVLLWLAGE